MNPKYDISLLFINLSCVCSNCALVEYIYKGDSILMSMSEKISNRKINNYEYKKLSDKNKKFINNLDSKFKCNPKDKLVNYQYNIIFEDKVIKYIDIILFIKKENEPRRIYLKNLYTKQKRFGKNE